MRSRRLDRAEVGRDMADPAARRASWEEYLAIDAASPTKNEYFDGQILAMAGGSEEHALLSMNMGVALSLARLLIATPPAPQDPPRSLA